MGTDTISLLLVEDDPEDYALTRRMLSQCETARYQIRWARSIEEAVDLLLAETFDVVLMDYFIGGETGREAFERLPGGLSRCPVVMLTGIGGRELDRISMDLGIEFFVSKQDLNDRVLDRAIRYAIRNKELKNRMSGFAKIVSHDTLGPARRVCSLLEMVEEELGDSLTPVAAQAMAMARRESSNLRLLLAALSDYLVKEGARPRPEARDLGEIVANAASFLKADVEAKGGRIEIGPLPQVWADPGQMLHVFMNLLQNSLKYASERAPEITVTSEVKDGRCLARVADNGIGFESKNATRIFQPLVRLHASSAYEGHGFGLAICREFVERNGGRIWAESEPGNGARFFVELPLAR